MGFRAKNPLAARPKYGAKPVYRDDAGNLSPAAKAGFFKVADSLREYEYWLIYQEDAKHGRIQNLRCHGRNNKQHTFALHAVKPDGTKVKLASYRPDFVFIKAGKLCVVDVKGFLTKEYRLKKRWLSVEYGIEIQEVR